MPTTFSTTPDNPINVQGLLRVDQIVRNRKRGIPGLLPISRSSFLQGVKEGRYPQPVKLGPRTTCWRASEILALVK